MTQRVVHILLHHRPQQCGRMNLLKSLSSFPTLNSPAPAIGVTMQLHSKVMIGRVVVNVYESSMEDQIIVEWHMIAYSAEMKTQRLVIPGQLWNHTDLPLPLLVYLI